MDLISKYSFTRSTRRPLSKIWLHFGFKADVTGKPSKKDEAICIMCRRKVLIKDGNTSNLRAHLRVHHPEEFNKVVFCGTSANGSASLQRLSGGSLDFEDNSDFSMPQSTPENLIEDRVVLGEPWIHGDTSRAIATLPSCLNLREMGAPEGSSEDWETEHRVFAKWLIHQGSVFGPFEGEVVLGHLTSFKYAWAVKEADTYHYIDASDENKSNWMRYVSSAPSEEEHNLIVFQWQKQIYYRVSQPIPQGMELKVCIGKEYAVLLGLGLGESIKCEYGNKEVLLGILQGIQVVTVPGGATASEPNDSHSWLSSSNQSHSTIPVISKVSSTSQIDRLDAPLELQDYDFVEGADKLLNHPNQTGQVRIWNFYGFEADPNGSGRALDKTRVICKLCGESVPFNNHMKALQYHLEHNHRMQHRNITGTHRSYRSRSSLRESTLTGNSMDSQCSAPCHELPTSHIRCSTHPYSSTIQTTNAIANFLIRDLLPPSMVEGEGFRQLIHTLLPLNQELPSAFQLEKILIDLHAQEREIWANVFTTNTENSEESKRTRFSHSTKSKSRTVSRRRSYSTDPSQVCKPHCVTLSADVWGRNWQGDRETYVTLWANYLDSDFSPHTLALGTQRLGESEIGNKDLTSVEGKVRAMALEWGISQPCLVLFGGEESEKMKLIKVENRNRRDKVGSSLNPNSTTSPEREDETTVLEQANHSKVEFPPIPCFFTVVEACIRLVMSHPVISRTLCLFQGLLSFLFNRHDRNRDTPPPCSTRKLFTALGQQELAELRSWAHTNPEWNRIYHLLQTLLSHQALLLEVIKEMGGDTQTTTDATSTKDSVSATSAPADSCDTNSIPHIPTYPSTTTLTTGYPESSDWKILEDLCSALKPLDVACNTIANEAYPRLSLIKPIITGLLSRHLAWCPGVSDILNEVKKTMSATLESCYNDPNVNRVLCLACGLDPQFYGLRFMEQKDQVATFDWLKKEAVRAEEDRRRGQLKSAANHRTMENKRNTSPLSLQEMDDEGPRRSKRLKEATPVSFKEPRGGEDDDDDDDDDKKEESEVESDASYQETEEDSEDDKTETMDVTEPNPASGMEFLLGDLYGPQSQSKLPSVEECVEAEVSLYRAEKDSALIEKHPFKWWRAKATLLPLLARVAQAYLAAPAVVGGAVEAFQSRGGGAMQRKRKNVPSEILDQLLFLHQNCISTTPSFCMFGKEHPN